MLARSRCSSARSDDGRSRGRCVPLVLLVAALVTAPLSLRAINGVMNATGADVSYLPSLETAAIARAVRPAPIERLQAANPEWVFIGDSMLGTRIDRSCSASISEHWQSATSRSSFQAASGPAWWFLAFKNHLIASGVKPRATFFFFRDTNMTDTMFRLENHWATARRSGARARARARCDRGGAAARRLGGASITR